MSEILESVLDEFKKLAAIPRQSKHEEQVSNFLKKYLSDFGFEVVQDENKNIIAEIPALCGLENAPLTILQAHMDMVCVAKEGVEYNPLTDPIKLVRTEEFLQAEGTSLGADDGIGISEILYIAKNHEKFSHGAIRIIFTTDEEQGMSGATNIDEKYFQDAKFLINCDSENFNEIVVGSAGHVYVNFRKKIDFITPDEKLQNSFRIKIFGLRGGHSGTEIASNRANAIKVIKNLLRLINGKGTFQATALSGGEASNVIPSSAEIVLVTDASLKSLEGCGDVLKKQFERTFDGAEPNLQIKVEPVERPQKVFSAKNLGEIMNLLTIIHSGVYAMSATVPGLVETSANIGIVRTEEEFLQIILMARSNVSEMLGEFEDMYGNAAAITNFEITANHTSPAWNYNPHSRLERIMTKIFIEQNNFAPKVHAIHAGLECSLFLTKNKSLDIVSIGTTNEHIHSPNERLHLKTVEPQVNLIIATLEKISEL